VIDHGSCFTPYDAAEQMSAWEAAGVLSSGDVDRQVHVTREGLFRPAARTRRGRVAVDTLRGSIEVPIACAS
jgi:hypothetical protein